MDTTQKEVIKTEKNFATRLAETCPDVFEKRKVGKERVLIRFNEKENTQIIIQGNAKWEIKGQGVDLDPEDPININSTFELLGGFDDNFKQETFRTLTADKQSVRVSITRTEVTDSDIVNFQKLQEEKKGKSELDEKRSEADNIVREAERKSLEILNQAQKTAEQIIKDAKEQGKIESTIPSSTVTKSVTPLVELSKQTTEIMSPEIKEFVDLYNQAVESGDESLFRKKYDIERMSTTNAMIRAQDSQVDPIFKNESSGAYWIGRIGNNYFVTVKPGLVYRDGLHEAGAMGKVFEVIGFEKDKKYQTIKLIKPAIFSRSGDTYILEEQGKLEVSEVV